MKKIIFLLIFSISSICAQVNFLGDFSSSFYTFESPTDNEQRINQYYGVNFKLTPEDYTDLHFKGNLKAIYDGNPGEWREKINSAYFSWKTPVENTFVQLGRQFVYAGVVNGTLDALSVSMIPAENMKLRLYGGTVAPFNRDFNLTNWDDGNVFGGFGSYQINNSTKVNASYFQKQRNDALYWQQLGTAVSGNYNDVFYIIKYDHNLLTSDYQTILANASYNYNNWSFTGELSSQKPKVYEDSFFSIFKLRAHEQFRLAVTHRIWQYDLGMQFINTMFEEDESSQNLIFTFGNNWGVIGVVYQTGFGGENTGLYADVNYQLLPNLRFNLHSSHYQYERESVLISEEATSFSAGVKYIPIKLLAVDLQLQQSINSYYKSDLRGLLKLAYSFNY
jgi:hypothetical protein